MRNHRPLYFAATEAGVRILLADAEPAPKLPAGKFIVHRGIGKTKNWTVTEAASGRRVAVGLTREAALERARWMIDASGEAPLPVWDAARKLMLRAQAGGVS